MRLDLLVALLVAAAAPGPPDLASGPQLTAAPKRVTLEDGSVLEVEAGELSVPESRRRPTQRHITIPYYRLRSQSSRPASPIFLLAGGPGSSWLDQLAYEDNAREVAFYRTLADVVLFDQRGGGHSRPEMTCQGTAELPLDKPLDPATIRTTLRTLLVGCRDHWLGEGVDLAAFNTVENAADVDDLRRALGYEKVTLVGGSYGSHLALQVMRRYPATVDRVVLFGVEGPDHTWDSPSGRLATFARIAETTERSAPFAGRIPEGGLLKAVERVLARLEAAPQTVAVTVEGTTRQVVVDAFLVRKLAMRGAGRRSAAYLWPEMILALDRGDYTLAAKAAIDIRTVRLDDPTHYSMDCASGISAERRRRYERDPARSLLGDINFEYEALCDLWPTEDLGEAFRNNVISNIPTLIVHGTWDTSTPIENAREVVTSLRRGQLIEVVGGNHGALYNLYERWAPMYPLMREFLAGKEVDFPDSVDDMVAVRFEPSAKP